MPDISVRAAARREIAKHGRYLEEHAGRAVTDRFLTAIVEPESSPRPPTDQSSASAGTTATKSHYRAYLNTIIFSSSGSVSRVISTVALLRCSICSGR